MPSAAAGSPTARRPAIPSVARRHSWWRWTTPGLSGWRCPPFSRPTSALTRPLARRHQQRITAAYLRALDHRPPESDQPLVGNTEILNPETAPPRSQLLTLDRGPVVGRWGRGRLGQGLGMA